jgi:hypothetical protein
MKDNNFILKGLNYVIFYFRLFYHQLFIFRCTNCEHSFFNVYLSLSYISCPHCKQEYCIYCIQHIHQENSEMCFYRYTILYVLGLMGLLTLYLKLVFVFYNYYLTRYFIVFFIILEFLVFNNKVDNLITTFLNVKNIILGILMIIKLDETDIILLIIVSIIQLAIIMLINMFKSILKKKIQSFADLIQQKIFSNLL